MKTYFYNRTVYRVLSQEVPHCFIALDGYFDSQFSSLEQSFSDHRVHLAENLCRRMGDIEMFAAQILDLQQHPDTLRSTLVISSYLAAHFGACKSLLDGGAMVLSHMYGLPLSNTQKDFSKPIFWQHLEQKSQDAFRRYESLF